MSRLAADLEIKLLSLRIHDWIFRVLLISFFF